MQGNLFANFTEEIILNSDFNVFIDHLFFLLSPNLEYEANRPFSR